MIITLAGNNSFLMQRRLNELVNKFLSEESDLALERIDASESTYEAILDAVASIPFLASNKMVVVRELSQNKQAAENVEQLISSISSSTQLVLVEPDIDKRTSFYKIVKTKTNLEEYFEKNEHELSNWLISEAKKLGGNILMTDANYLIERVGLNQGILFNELNKLIINSPEITQESIDLLTEKAPSSKVFDLLDATFAGKKQKALDLYEQQRAQKVEPEAILALLIWQLNILSLAKYGAGKSANQIAKDARLNPYPVQKAQSLATKISNDKLSEMIGRALDIDHKSKTISIDLDEALKAYIVSL
jgi:DNA polymerase III subunit delta